MTFFIGVRGNFAEPSTRLLHTLSQLILFVNDVEDVAVVDQRWRRDEDDLEDPESNVRDWEGVVVADVFATWLLGVADHFRLFVAPHLQRAEMKLATC